MPEPSLPFPTSQCHGCAHLKLVEGKTTVFLLCQALPVKYPRQPVRGCAGFAPRLASPG